MRVVRAGVAALVVVTLAGCIPGAPSTSPTPSPSPTFLCTPEAGGTQAPCSQQQYDEMKRKDALYVEAEAVYRKYQQEFFKVIQAGGADQLSPGIRALIGDDELAKGVLQRLKDFKNDRLRIEGPGTVVKWAHRRPSIEMKGSAVAMEFCADASSTRIYEGTKMVGSGSIIKETTYFRPSPQVLKMVAVQFEDVESCAE